MITKFKNKNRPNLQKVIISFFIFFVSISSLFSQNKNYNGPYKTRHFTGNATYEYIEGEGSRIYNGNFSFKTTDGTVNIIGGYKNDLRHGHWIFNYNKARVGFRSGNITSKFEGNYVDSELSGKWSFTRNTSILTSGGKYIIDNSTATFNNNKFTGKFHYDANISISTYGRTNFKNLVEVNGTFDKYGFCDGLWILTSIDRNNIKFIQKIIFKHGIIYYSTEENTSTGEIVTLTNVKELVDIFFENYDDKKNESIIENKVLCLSTSFNHIKETDNLMNFGHFIKSTDLIDIFNIWIKEYQYNDLNYLGEIDKGFKEIKSPFNSIFINFTKTENLKYEQKNKEMIEVLLSKSDSLYNINEYEKAIETYNKILKRDPNNEYSKNQISKIKIELNSLKEQKFNSYISKADSLYKIAKHEESIEFLKMANNIKPNESFVIRKISETERVIAEINLKKELLELQNKVESSHNQILKQYSSTKAEQVISFINQDYRRTRIREKKTIKKAYLLVYERTIQEYKNDLKRLKDFSTIQDRLSKLCDFDLIKLSNNLKNTKDYDEIFNILLK